MQCGKQQQQQQRSHLRSRRALSSSAYGQHIAAQSSTEIRRVSASSAGQQQLSDAAAAATAAAAVAHAPLPSETPTPARQQAVRQCDDASSGVLPAALPPSLQELLVQYSSLQDQLNCLLPVSDSHQHNQQHQPPSCLPLPLGKGKHACKLWGLFLHVAAHNPYPVFAVLHALAHTSTVWDGCLQRHPLVSVPQCEAWQVLPV